MAMGIPGGTSLQLSNNEQFNPSQTGKQSNDAGGGGYRGSVINNIATGASKLSASTSASDIPKWVWVAMAVAAALMVWVLFRYRK